jgi:hypothetical protein
MRLDEARRILAVPTLDDEAHVRDAQARVALEEDLARPDLAALADAAQREGGGGDIAAVYGWCRDQLSALKLGLDSGGQSITTDPTVIGAYLPKTVDVVALHPTAGPTLAISVKSLTRGVTKNLTNRVEEYVGEATNLHTRYPMLVFGFLLVLEIRTVARTPSDPDIMFDERDGELVPRPLAVRVMERVRTFGDRRLLTDPVGSYEATTTLFAINWTAPDSGLGPGPVSFSTTQPPRWSDLSIQRFFLRLSEIYQERNPMLVPRDRLEGRVDEA